MVNVRDYYDENLNIKGDKLKAIFTRQWELMHKYHDIEKEQGLLVSEKVPVDLHDRFGQFRLKDFAWRIAEELGEALEALDKNTEDFTHFYEEVSDALHFLVEFTILAGVYPDDLVKEQQERTENLDMLETLYLKSLYGPPAFPGDQKIYVQVAVFIKNLAVTCNTLKNKPWKKTHMLTDVDRFKECLVNAWLAFIAICRLSHLGPNDLVKMYFGKSEVNKFRQRSDY